MVVLLWFSVACFWCQSFDNVSPDVCSLIFRLLWIAEWLPFGKELPTWLTICSHCILTNSNFSYFPFLFLRVGFGF